MPPVTTTPKREKAPVIFIELADKRDSGFVRDGTEGTRFEERLNCASKFIIPSQGWRAVEENGSIVHEEIRYIKGQREISVAKQKAQDIKPSPKSLADKIIVEHGSMSIAREGSTIGLYDYLKSVFYNESSENRSPNASALFRVIDLTKVEEEINERDMLINEAVGFVYTLQTKKGGEYIYQEEKINSYCELFNVSAERMPSKITALAGLAKMYPKEFLEKIAILEQSSATLVTHALQLNVIKFETNTAIYIQKNKIIKDLGIGKMSHGDKVNKLAEYLRTKDGHEAYNELMAEVDFAKQKQLED